MEDRSKITEAQYYALFYDPKISEAEILEYSQIIQGKGGFDWRIVPDPERVETSLFRSAGTFLGLGNGAARIRREIVFNYRLEREDKPILVSEGDSWFQFP